MNSESELHDLINSIKSPYKLLLMDRYIKEALEKLGVSKSKGNPVGEYAEFLVARALKGKRMPNAKEGHDLTLEDGTKIEVKGRIFEGKRIPMSDLKDSTIKQKTFDYLVYIVFTESMRVKYAMKISHSSFQQVAKYSEQRNSPPKWRLTAKKSLLSNNLVEDITTTISTAVIE